MPTAKKKPRDAEQPARSAGDALPIAGRRHDRVTIKRETFVLVPEDEYRANAGLPPLPPLPEADADGNLPAVEAARVNIAREVVRRREAAGLTQRQLAAAADITPAMLCRVERAAVTATTATLTRIDAALVQATAEVEAKAGR